MLKTSSLSIFALTLVTCTESQIIESTPPPLTEDWETIKNTRSIEKYQQFLFENPQTEFFSEIIDSCRGYWKRKGKSQANLLLLHRNAERFRTHDPQKNRSIKTCTGNALRRAKAAPAAQIIHISCNFMKFSDSLLQNLFRSFEALPRTSP